MQLIRVDKNKRTPKGDCRFKSPEIRAAERTGTVLFSITTFDEVKHPTSVLVAASSVARSAALP